MHSNLPTSLKRSRFLQQHKQRSRGLLGSSRKVCKRGDGSRYTLMTHFAALRFWSFEHSRYRISSLETTRNPWLATLFEG